MRIEREGIDPQYPSYLYCLPDGTLYESVYFPPDISDKEALQIGVTIASQKTLQTRIISDSQDQIEILGNSLRKLGYEVAWGGNTFFESPVLQLEESKKKYTKFEWYAFESEFTVARINNSPYDKEIFKSLMIGSFGRKKIDGKFEPDDVKIKNIINIFDEAVISNKNYIFLARSKEHPTKILGGFVLNYLAGMNEVQLNCVAGISSHQSVIM